MHSGNPRLSVIDGYARSSRVVTAAAIIMIGVFAAFILDPDPITKSIGLALAVGVLFDAFVVRLTLIPAVMTLLGRSAWKLPHWMERFIPRVAMEGGGAADGIALIRHPP